MPKISMRQLVSVGLALFLVGGLFLVDSNAQRRKRKRKPRPRPRPTAPLIMNPAIYQPSPGVDQNANPSGTGESVNTEQGQKTAPPTEDPEAMKKTIHTLSNQVDKLTQKIGQMEESQRSLVDLERLSRAEQRSSQLRSELRDSLAKEAELQARLEDIQFSLKPENIERSTAGYGTTRPEELREQRRRQLESEKVRVQRQLDQLAGSRTRLEQAITTSDTEIERLQKRLDAADQAAIENAKTKAQAEGTSSTQSVPSASPTPSPYRPQ